MSFIYLKKDQNGIFRHQSKIPYGELPYHYVAASYPYFGGCCDVFALTAKVKQTYIENQLSFLPPS